MSKFITIDELINVHGFSHSSLANFIELNGVFGCDIDKNIHFYDSDSPDIERAFVGIFHDLDDKLNREIFGHEWEAVADADLYRFQGQGPNYFFGWPDGKEPAPWDVNENPNWIGSRLYTISSGIFAVDSRIYSIGRLLVTCKATAAEIATAIEKYGIYGFDDYDRLKLITYDFSYPDALSALADWTKMIKNDSSLKKNVFDDARLSQYGWPRGDLPSFAGVPKGYGLTKEESVSAKEAVGKSDSADADEKTSLDVVEDSLSLHERQSYQALIGSLIAYIQHKNKGVKKADLLRWFNDNAKIRGNKRTTSLKLFREGEDIFKEITQLLAEHNIILPEDDSKKPVDAGKK
jgi:hypothetical protein